MWRIKILAALPFADKSYIGQTRWNILIKNKRYNYMDLKEMQKIDVNSVNIDSLVDIRNVVINEKLSQEEKVKDYLTQVQNPYCYRFDDYVVKISFSDTTATMTDRLNELISKIASSNL
ncbi:hypothetical protein LJC58_06595 [Lachnospiraceae bacterium OttesenSCG-928-D06]|nr:hypothetical protein [Lachnospiraceae bacterium OttesenSCG-928-D06]